MERIKWVFVFSVIGLIVCSPCHAQEWAYLYDPPGTIHNIQQTSTDDYLLFGGSQILTIHPDGTVAGDVHIWSADGLSIYSTEQTPDQGFIFAGHIRGYEVTPYGWHGLAVFKTNADGTIAWANKYHAYEQETEPYAYCIQNTPDGGCIVGGEKGSYAGQERSCILKLDSAGMVEWYQEMDDDTRRSYVKAVRVTADNGYVAAGYFDVDETSKGAWLGKLDASGDFEWEKVFDSGALYSVEETSNGHYIAVGRGVNSNKGYQVLEVDSLGNLVWHKVYDTVYYVVDEGTGIEWYSQYDGYAMAIQETNDNGYVVAGYRDSGAWFIEADVLMLKLDAFGNLDWNRIFRGPYSAKAFSVRQTTDDGYVLAGTRVTEPSLPTTSAAWLIKTDENGDIPTCGDMAIADVTVTSLFNEGENANGSWSSWLYPHRVEIDVTRKSDASVSRSDGCPLVPTIDKIGNRKCYPGDIIKIRGSGFGDEQGESVVHINKLAYNETSSRIKLWSDTLIKVKIPFGKKKCSWFIHGDGEYRKRKVWVTITGGIDTNSKKIRVLKPESCQ
jgi:hypothetical protein